MLVKALVKNTYHGACFGLATTEGTIEGATALSLVKDKAADLSCLFEGRNCHVPPSATRGVFWSK